MELELDQRFPLPVHVLLFKFRFCRVIQRISDLLYFTEAVHIHYELRALTELAFHRNRPAHLLYNAFANRKPQTSPLRIPFRIFIKLRKVNEQMLKPLLRYSNARIYDT